MTTYKQYRVCDNKGLVLTEWLYTYEEAEEWYNALPRAFSIEEKTIYDD